MSRSEDMVYIARKSCGCCVVVMVDNPDHRRDTAREIARCVRDGLAVERVTLEAFRAVPLGCKCGKPVKQEVLL